MPIGVGRGLTVREGPLALRAVGARGGGGWREGGGLRRGGRRALGAPRHGQRVPAGALGDTEGGLWDTRGAGSGVCTHQLGSGQVHVQVAQGHAATWLECADLCMGHTQACA